MRYIVYGLFALLLSGCEMSGKTENVQAGVEQPNQDCHQWCHNGWCSKHCDPIATE